MYALQWFIVLPVILVSLDTFCSHTGLAVVSGLYWTQSTGLSFFTVLISLTGVTGFSESDSVGGSRRQSPLINASLSVSLCPLGLEVSQFVLVQIPAGNSAVRKRYIQHATSVSSPVQRHRPDQSHIPTIRSVSASGKTR